MADICILFSEADSGAASFLGQKLGAAGLAVEIGRLNGAPVEEFAHRVKAFIALWSPNSGNDEGLLASAAAARSLGQIIHTRMLGAPSPAAFAADASVDLSGWKGEDEFPAWISLVKVVKDKVAAPAPLTAPAAVAPPPPPEPEPVVAAPPAPEPEPVVVAPPAPEPEPVVVAPPPPPPEPVVVVPPPPPPEPVVVVPPPPPPEPVVVVPPPPPPPVAPPPPPPAVAPAPATNPPQQARAAAPPPPPEPVRRGGGAGLLVTLLALAALGVGGYFGFQAHQRGDITLPFLPPSAERVAAERWAAMDLTSAEALRAYLAESPPVSYAELATMALSDLERARFEQAMSSTDVADIEAFIASFPDNADLAAQARSRIASLRQADDAAAAAIADPDGLAEPGDSLAPSPAPPPAMAPSPNVRGAPLNAPPPAEPQ